MFFHEKRRNIGDNDNDDGEFQLKQPQQHQGTSQKILSLIKPKAKRYQEA